MGIFLLLSTATLTAPGLLNDNWPPARFMGDRNGVTIELLSPQAIYVLCGKPPEPMDRHGCSNKGEGWIAIRNPCLAPRWDDYARDLCHELGHMNGWPLDHPR